MSVHDNGQVPTTTAAAAAAARCEVMGARKAVPAVGFGCGGRRQNALSARRPGRRRRRETQHWYNAVAAATQPPPPPAAAAAAADAAAAAAFAAAAPAEVHASEGQGGQEPARGRACPVQHRHRPVQRACQKHRQRIGPTTSAQAQHQDPPAALFDFTAGAVVVSIAASAPLGVVAVLVPRRCRPRKLLPQLRRNIFGIAVLALVALAAAAASE